MKKYFIADIVEKTDETVELYGWVDTKRDHKKVVFIDLRDRSAIVQVVGGEELKQVSTEDVVKIEGKVVKRPEKLVNPNIITGRIEVQCTNCKILNNAETVPIPVNTDGYEIEEETRLKYRYLDLRRPRMQKNLLTRSQFIQYARDYLFRKEFLEVETPLLTRSTPEGSRDFLVPSRLQQGMFYALPQSPQQYKQLLMTGGVERYFQIARAVRDEDLRADRGFEHTQIDIEMSFVERDDVMHVVEQMMIETVEKLGYTIKEKPFPRITYANAMKQYGADKFDLRTDQEKKDGVLAYAWVIEFPFFEKTDTGEWTFSHNPFSMPMPEHVESHLAKKNIESILTTQYDLVCNGHEAGGGSIRTHNPDVLQATYEIMGYSKEKIEASVGHMLQAFRSGTPPHGGIALGVERNLMTLMGETYLREVQAFPMTSGGKTAVMEAPSTVDDDQLTELGIQVVGE
jgi:aspartyl-tRNA synthetase